MTQQVSGALAPAVPPRAPANPSGNVGSCGFAQRPETHWPTYISSSGCRVVADGSNTRYTH